MIKFSVTVLTVFLTVQTVISTNFTEEEKGEIGLSCNGDYYTVTASTMKQLGTGQDYSIPLRICGNDYGNGISVNFVEVLSNGRWVKISHTKDFRSSGRYYITVDYETYYFTI